MLCEDLFIAGVGAYLPPARDVAEAVRRGNFTAEAHAEQGYRTVTVSADVAPPDMAVLAGRRALERASAGPDEFGLLLHCSSWYQGIDFFPTASYVHREVLAGCQHCPAVDVQQMSNGVGALELAACRLSADGTHTAALVTAADRFLRPGFDRWAGDGMVFGDGAGALVLRRGNGFARVLSLDTRVDTWLLGAAGGDEAFGPVAGHVGHPVDVRGRRRSFVSRRSSDDVRERVLGGFSGAVLGALGQHGLGLGDVSRVVLPNVGRASMQAAYLDPLGLDMSATTWEFGRHTGHVGAADQMIGLCHLVETGQVGPGDRVLLVGIGAGFSWSCAVLEVLGAPSWTTKSS